MLVRHASLWCRRMRRRYRVEPETKIALGNGDGNGLRVSEQLQVTTARRMADLQLTTAGLAPHPPPIFRETRPTSNERRATDSLCVCRLALAREDGGSAVFSPPPHVRPPPLPPPWRGPTQTDTMHTSLPTYGAARPILDRRGFNFD
jgi:hypothetical protein